MGEPSTPYRPAQRRKTGPRGRRRGERHKRPPTEQQTPAQGAPRDAPGRSPRPREARGGPGGQQPRGTTRKREAAGGEKPTHNPKGSTAGAARRRRRPAPTGRKSGPQPDRPRATDQPSGPQHGGRTECATIAGLPPTGRRKGGHRTTTGPHRDPRGARPRRERGTTPRRAKQPTNRTGRTPGPTHQKRPEPQGLQLLLSLS